MTFTKIITGSAVAGLLAVSSPAFADDHVSISGEDQDVSGGTVTASKIMADENGWLVVHRTDDSNKPGPVVAHAPIRKGENTDVVGILTEPVNSGDKLMLMIHSEAGGNQTGIFEYTLGAKEDGPIKPGGNLVMTVITAQ